MTHQEQQRCIEKLERVLRKIRLPRDVRWHQLKCPLPGKPNRRCIVFPAEPSASTLRRGPNPYRTSGTAGQDKFEDIVGLPATPTPADLVREETARRERQRTYEKYDSDLERNLVELEQSRGGGRTQIARGPQPQNDLIVCAFLVFGNEDMAPYEPILFTAGDVNSEQSIKNLVSEALQRLIGRTKPTKPIPDGRIRSELSAVRHDLTRMAKQSSKKVFTRGSAERAAARLTTAALAHRRAAIRKAAGCQASAVDYAWSVGERDLFPYFPNVSTIGKIEALCGEIDKHAERERHRINRALVRRRRSPKFKTTIKFQREIGPLVDDFLVKKGARRPISHLSPAAREAFRSLAIALEKYAIETFLLPTKARQSRNRWHNDPNKSRIDTLGEMLLAGRGPESPSRYLWKDILYPARQAWLDSLGQR